MPFYIARRKRGGSSLERFRGDICPANSMQPGACSLYGLFGGFMPPPFLSQDAPHGIRAKGAVFFEARMEVRASLMFIGVS